MIERRGSARIDASTLEAKSRRPPRSDAVVTRRRLVLIPRRRHVSGARAGGAVRWAPRTSEST
jgi:hypothetical protein